MVRIFFLLWIAMIFNSCANRYIDNLGKGTVEPVKGPLFEVYSSYNLFSYKSNVTLSRDTEKVYPRYFEIRLPKGIVYYEINGISDFGFYYDHHQVIFVKLKLEAATSKADSVYVPQESDLLELIGGDLSTSGNKRYDIKSFKRIEGTKNCVIDKGDAMIILYNIQEEAFNSFYKEVNTFRYLP
jgi:hypothetical protein